MGSMKTGPFKPAPDIPQGFYIAAEDRAKYMKALADGNRIDLAAEMGLSRELPDIEEQTIKRQMDMKAALVAYPDGASLDTQANAELLKAAGLKRTTEVTACHSVGIPTKIQIAAAYEKIFGEKWVDPEPDSGSEYLQGYADRDREYEEEYDD